MIKRLIYLILVIIYIIPTIILVSFALVFLSIDFLIWLITGKEVSILDKMIYYITSFTGYLNRKLWQKD